ncbi:hypothetical protein HK097_000885 [Rhizophlyctis rosea]|uniref:SGNH hydrolase-type esterase domain-containing protein n=1 Tax=Rhizophlyctis rosea TaxID=64517 RepID=A0AAD5S7H7_9FUNG|nr:hypothetical protein HK097_000885 [Rhizophlyctis rosea]
MTADSGYTYTRQDVPDTIYPIQLDQIIVFGDSITQEGHNPLINGWVASLAHFYQRRLDVINRGMSGYTSEWCKHLLPSVLSTTLPAPLPNSTHQPKVRLVTICMGANDAVNEGMRQYCPLPDFKQNLKEMISMVHSKHPDAKVLLISAPPLGLKLWKAFLDERSLPMDRVISRTRSYAQAAIEVGAETNTPVVDTWKAFFGGNGEWDERADQASWFYDGLHPSTEGSQVLWKAVRKAIVENWPELDPNGDMKEVLPPWDQFGIDDLAKELFQTASERK